MTQGRFFKPSHSSFDIVPPYIWSVFNDKNLSQYSNLMDSFACPNMSRFHISLPKLIEAPKDTVSMIKAGMKDFKKSLNKDLKDRNFFNGKTGKK